jgi:hypothetical protein
MAGGDPTARLVLNLEGNVDSAAKGDAEALAELRSSLQAAADESVNVNKALRALKGTEQGSSDAAQELKKRKDTLKEAQASLVAKFVSAGGALDQLNLREKKESEQNAKSTKQQLTLRQEIEKVSPAVARLGKSYTALQGTWMLSAAAGVVLVGALAAVTAGTVAASVALTKYGLAAADAARNERLMLEGLVRARGQLGNSENIAAGFQKAIDRVAGDVPIARDEVAGLAKELYGMRLRGDSLEKMLRGMALAKSVGQNFWALGMSTQMTGRSMLDLAKIAEQRFGPVVAKQMFSLSVQSMKLREQLKSLFAGVNIVPLGMAMKGVTDSLKESSVVGWELRRALENLFAPFIGDAGKAGDLIPAVMTKIAIKGLELESYLLDLAISAKRWWVAGGDEVAAGKVKAALGDIRVIAEATAKALGVAADAAGFFLKAFDIPDELFNIEDAKLNGEARSRAAGENIAKSFAAGLNTGNAVVFDASKALAMQTQNAFASAMQMHSPSKIMVGLGFRAGESVGIGMRQAAPMVQRSAAALVEPRAIPAPNVGTVAGGGGGTTVYVEAIHIDAGGKGSAQEIAEEIPRALLNLLSGVRVRIGAAPMPQGANR